MTTANHTPLPFGGPLTSAAMEAPLGQLDAAIATVIATGSGVSTTTTAIASSGQATILVASSAGFAPGDPIYIVNADGSFYESRIVATVPGGGVSLTVTVNLTNTYAVSSKVSKSPVEIVDARGGQISLGVRLALIQNQVFNVKASPYNAKGDDTTNDTTAIQAAFDACHAAGGGIVYFPPGSYRFNAVLEMPYPATIIGAGPEATKLSYFGSNGTLLRFKNYGTAAQRLYMQIGHFTLANVGSATAVTGMDLKGMCRSLVERILLSGIIGASSIGILVDGSYGSSIGAWWNTIRNIQSGFAGTGIKFTGVVGAGQANENVVRDCTIAGASVAAVNVDVGDNVVIERCDLTTTQGGTGVILNHTTATVRNCRFENNAIGVDITHTGSTSQDRNRIEDCLFLAGAGSTHGIRIAAAVTGTRLRANKFSGSFSTAQIEDNSTVQDGVTNAGNLIPLLFSVSNIPINQASVALVPVGVDPSNLRIYLGRPYRIRGVTARLSVAATTGTLAFKPTIGGVDSAGLSANWNAGAGSGGGTSTTARSWQGVGKDEDSGGSGVGCSMTTNGTWAPTTSDATVIVWVEIAD